MSAGEQSAVFLMPDGMQKSDWSRFWVTSSFVTPIDFDLLADHVNIHKQMIDAGSMQGLKLRSVCYLKVPADIQYASSASSLRNVNADAEQYYERIDKELNELLVDNGDSAEVEAGAAKSALVLVDQMKRRSLAPPEMSWHGGDAVVMLWTLGDTTYAITVTDGEFGYVVRRGRKAVRLADSIKLDAFRIEDLR